MDLGLYSIYYLYTEFLYQATIEILIDRNRSIGWIISLFHSLHFSIRRFCDECMHVWWWLQVWWKSCIIYGNLIHVAEKIKFSFNIVYFIRIPCKSGYLFDCSSSWFISLLFSKSWSRNPFVKLHVLVFHVCKTIANCCILEENINRTEQKHNKDRLLPVFFHLILVYHFIVVYIYLEINYQHIFLFI